MARKRTFSHFFFEKKCVFVPKSFIWLPREGRDVLAILQAESLFTRVEKL